MLYCIALYYIILCCVVLYCIVLCCVALYCIVLCCVVLCCCIVLYCIVLYCIVLYCIVFHLCFSLSVPLNFIKYSFICDRLLLLIVVKNNFSVYLNSTKTKLMVLLL